MPSFTPFPQSEELVFKFLEGVSYTNEMDESINVHNTFYRLPTYLDDPHITFFLYETKYYTNTRNDLLGVNKANFLFSVWGCDITQCVNVSRQCIFAIHNFPPWKIAWRILTNLKDGTGVMGSGDVNTGLLSTLDMLNGRLAPDGVDPSNYPDPIEELREINIVLNGILADPNLNKATNSSRVKELVERIAPRIENFGFTLCVRNHLDNLRPQQIESGYYERLIEVEFLNGG